MFNFYEMINDMLKQEITIKLKRFIKLFLTMFKCFFERFILIIIKAAIKNTKIKITTIKFKERANKKEEILYAMNYFTHKIKINEVLMKAFFDNNVEINVINEEIAKMTQLLIKKN